MRATAKRKKAPATVALGRKGGLARAAKTTADKRTFNEFQVDEARSSAAVRSDISDQAFMALLKRYKASNDPTGMESLSEQIERMIFHKQYENVKA